MAKKKAKSTAKTKTESTAKTKLKVSDKIKKAHPNFDKYPDFIKINIAENS